MKSIFDENTLGDLVKRLDSLSPQSDRQWGKMSPSQMMEHCYRALEMASGNKPIKQVFLGKILSWIFKKEFVSEKPFHRNRPTGPDFIIKDDPDFDATREKLKRSLVSFHELGESGTDGNIHGFFGPLTGKQWGETQYKHLDHHLRQFGK